MEQLLILSRRDYDAVIFDLDGVITDTAVTHRRAWKEVFDELLHHRCGTGFDPFTDEDYQRFVDGKPRLDGIQSFLSSRNIEFDSGSEDADPGFDSIAALGAEKNRRYRKRLAHGEIDVIGDSLQLVKELHTANFLLGLVSSSRNAKLVLHLLEIGEWFGVRIDGVTLAEEGLRGKPAPDMFLEAARRLGTRAERAVVVEDAESGVEAGRAGGFGLVIGLAADAERRRALMQAGADVAVESLSAFDVSG